MNSTRGPCLQLIDFYVIYIYRMVQQNIYRIKSADCCFDLCQPGSSPRLQVNLLDPPAVDISCTIKMRPRLQSSLFSTNLPSGN